MLPYTNINPLIQLSVLTASLLAYFGMTDYSKNLTGDQVIKALDDKIDKAINPIVNQDDKFRKIRDISNLKAGLRDETAAYRKIRKIYNEQKKRVELINNIALTTGLTKENMNDFIVLYVTPISDSIKKAALIDSNTLQDVINQLDLDELTFFRNTPIISELLSTASFESLKTLVQNNFVVTYDDISNLLNEIKGPNGISLIDPEILSSSLNKIDEIREDIRNTCMDEALEITQERYLESVEENKPIGNLENERVLEYNMCVDYNNFRYKEVAYDLLEAIIKSQ